MNSTLKATGLLTALVVVSAHGALAGLPAKSEFRLRKYWGAQKSILAIKQTGDSVLIQSIGPPSPGLGPTGLTALWGRPVPAMRGGEHDRATTPNGNGSSLREGSISRSEFRVFWDSLERLGFWRLGNAYRALASRSDEAGGELSVDFETRSHHTTMKAVRFFAPESCSPEFRQVYALFENMARYAKSVPGWRVLLSYETEEPIEGLKDWYHAEALQAIAAARDTQGLDTLLSMLLRDDEYAPATIEGLANIGSNRAVPALAEFLAMQALKAARLGARYDEGNAVAATKALAAVNGSQSLPAIRSYLDATYRVSDVYTWVGLLAGIGDYSLVPDVVQILGDSSSNRRWYVIPAAQSLGRIGYRSQAVISVLLSETQRELNKPDLDNGIVDALLSALRVLTGQAFTYRPEDPLQAKRANLETWLRWWTAHASQFPAGNATGNIHFNSTPPGAEIWLDGAKIGKTTPFAMFDVKAAKYHVRLTKERYGGYSSSVTVGPERSAKVEPVLSETFGSLRVLCTPDASIYLDGPGIGKRTPRLISRISTGKHRLRLVSSDAYRAWDSTVTIIQGETTTVKARLTRSPESLWITYAKPRAPRSAVLRGPERAVRFNAVSKSGNSLRITKVSAEFITPKTHQWSDSSFRFKIYRCDGQTLLYQSPVLKATADESGLAVVHELSNPFRIYIGDEFFVSVAPTGTSGEPASAVVRSSNERRPWAAGQDGVFITRSYVGSPWHWSPLEEGELVISVLGWSRL